MRLFWVIFKHCVLDFEVSFQVLKDSESVLMGTNNCGGQTAHHNGLAFINHWLVKVCNFR